jgi:uncharacterized repeat protein (TIGR02543 family)
MNAERKQVKGKHMRKRFKRGIAAFMAITMIMGSLQVTGRKTSAAETSIVTLGGGSIAGSATTEMSAFVSKLPSLENSGIYRFTTEKYNENNGAFDTNNWATSAMWNHDEGNSYSGSIYANPMSYWATKEGMWISKPSTRVGSTYVVMTQYNDGAFTDFNIKPYFEFSDAKVDNITDWTYDVVFENKTNASQYMKTTMTQGSPFGFFQLNNSKKVDIVRKRTKNESVITYFNGTSLTDSTYVVIRVYDPDDEKVGYSSYDYYAVYVPKGTKWTQSGNSSTNIGTLSLEFPSNDKAYFTVAWLDESGKDDESAEKIAKQYAAYAYNFITDTRAEYSYDENSSIVTTTYKYTVEKKTESTAEGTIMGIMPHQYKYMTENKGFLENTARTIRGTVKYKIGDSFTTNLKFSGVLPYAPSIDETDNETLQSYVNEFISEKMPDGSNYQLCVDEASGDPYTYGKQLNRSSNVLAAAESVGDSESAAKIMKGLESSLSDWFTYSGSGDAKYFAYYDGIGTLLSQPNSYNSIDQMNDHHFHYGYFIAAAAQVALRDNEWAEKYDLVVKELINDIACTERNNSNSRYPYLRNFSPFEGHSWASGFEDVSSGNNQESTSEAMNAWYGIILYGMATGDDEIRDLGIYLYTTELSAINNYWFDVDGDVLDDYYVYQGTDTVKNNLASLVWSGKYDYATWFSGDPAMIQGIQLLPITAGSYYLASDKDYIKESVEVLNRRGNSGSWNDVWSEYLALADPDAGFENWSGNVSEDGESKAHIYQYIKSLQKYGTPELSISSNMPLSMVFVDETGTKTYVAYNTGDTIKTAIFSDGAKFSTKAGEMTVISEKEMEGQEYYIEYYLQDLNGEYTLESTDIKYAEIGDTVSVSGEVKNGYTLNTKNDLTVTSGKVTEKGLTLKLYYDRNTYTINYHLEDGINGDNPTEYIYGENYTLSAPTKEGCTFRGWYTDSTYTNKLESITSKTYGNLDLYARWASENDYYINDTMYLQFVNGIATFTVEGKSDVDGIVALYKIYDNEQEAKNAAANKNIAGFTGYNMAYSNGKWNCQVDLNNYKDKYMVFVFNILSGTNSGLSDWGCCVITEGVTEIPLETSSVGNTESSSLENVTTSGQTGNSSYAKLNYVKIDNDYEVACVSADNSSVISRTENQGSSLYIATNAVAGVITPDYKAVTINGITDNSPRAGANFWAATSLLTKRYNVILVQDSVGNICEFVIKANKIAEETEVITTTEKATESVTTATESATSKETATAPQIETSSEVKTTVEDTIVEVSTQEGTTSQSTTESEDTTQVESATANGEQSTSSLEVTTNKEVTTTKKKAVKISKAKIKKLSRKKKSIVIKMKKQKNISGYEVQISSSKKFKKKKTKTKYVKKSKFKIKKPATKKKCYVRVRAYVKVKNKKYFGKWSKRKTVN